MLWAVGISEEGLQLPRYYLSTATEHGHVILSLLIIGRKGKGKISNDNRLRENRQGRKLARKKIDKEENWQ